MTLMQFSVSKASTLTKSNYRQWRTDMELRLTALGLWDLVSLERPPVVDAERRRKEALVLADIRNAVDPSLKDSIAGARHPKEALWQCRRCRRQFRLFALSHICTCFGLCSSLGGHVCGDSYGRAKL